MRIRKNRCLVRNIVLAVTFKCNGKCSFCNIWKNRKLPSLKASDYKILPRSLRNINISGGEPLLREDIVDIVRTIARQCSKAKITISTNGFAPSVIKKRMQEIMKFKRDVRIEVSLDGFGKIHEKLRNFPGGFSLALETIRLLRELGVRNIKIVFTMGDHNVSQLKRIYRLSRELGVGFVPAIYHNSTHFYQKDNNRITQLSRMLRELNWLARQQLKGFSPRQWINAYFTQGMICFLESSERALPDYAGIDSIFIDPSGSIYPSGIWSLNMGQVKRIRSWAAFSRRAKKMVAPSRTPLSWMPETVHPAMRKHLFKVGWWAIRAKLRSARARYFYFWRPYNPSVYGCYEKERIA